MRTTHRLSGIGLLICLVCASLLLTGCTLGSRYVLPAQSELKESFSFVHDLIFATGEMSGTYTRVGSVLASLWSSALKSVKVTTQSTGGSTANLMMLGRGEVDLALSASNSAYRAYMGIGPFEQPIDRLRAIAALYPEVFHFVVRKDSPFAYISEIKGLRVAVGSRMGGTHLTTREVFQAHGISPEDVRMEYLSFSEAIFALQAGMADVAVIGAGMPTRAVQEAAAMMEIRLLEVEEDKIQGFINNQPYLDYYKIPAGMYRGIDHDVLTVASPALLVTTSETPGYLVRNLLEVLFNSSEILAGNIHTKDISLQSATRKISIPMHDGARLYYAGAGEI